MFQQVVFAGGGHRCWWQAGFWDVVAPRIALRPRVVAGVSALVAVSAPTSLALDTAREFGLTVIGFARTGVGTQY